MPRKRRKLTRGDYAVIFRDNDGRCHLCGFKILNDEWEAEHPRARGLNVYAVDPDEISLLRPAHVDCHKPKTKRDKQMMAKADRIAKREAKVKPKGRAINRWRKFDGTPVYKERT